MNIGPRAIGLEHPPYIVAELGVNHDGSAERAIQLVNAAHHAGADAIKLQLFQTRRLLGKASTLAAYQTRSGVSDPFLMLQTLELSEPAAAEVVGRAHDAGLDAIVTLFSVELVPLAEGLPFDAYKTASPDLINRPLIEALMGTGKPLLVSTGATSPTEVAAAARWLGDHPHVLLHCVSSYPTPESEAALGGRMAMLRISPHAVGYSDHTTCLDTGALAVAGGACLLEKHLTHDRDAIGPDHAASLDPEQLTEYVRLAHRAWHMRGPIEKRVSPLEEDVRTTSRQSLTTTHPLAVGHVLRREDLTVKRPGTGISPARLDDVIGRTVACAVEADMPLTEEHLS